VLFPNKQKETNSTHPSHNGIYFALMLGHLIKRNPQSKLQLKLPFAAHCGMLKPIRSPADILCNEFLTADDQQLSMLEWGRELRPSPLYPLYFSSLSCIFAQLCELSSCT